jgi:hypothetical protein
MSIKPSVLFFVAAIATTGLGAAACHNEPAKGPAEKAGEKVDNAAQDVKDDAHETKKDIQHDVNK